MADGPTVKKNARFGKLVVIRGPLGERLNHSLAFECRCDCGQTRLVEGRRLRDGLVKSCQACGYAAGAAKAAKHNRTHGQSHSRTFKRWQGMLERCRSKRHDVQRLYRDRGITVCRRWKNSFESFLKDMGRCPAGRTLERLDNNKPYQPGNCIWATRKQQAANRRTNRRITFRGKTLMIVEWARRLGVHPSVITNRLNCSGYPEWLAVSCPLGLRGQARCAFIAKWEPKACS